MKIETRKPIQNLNVMNIFQKKSVQQSISTTSDNKDIRLNPNINLIAGGFGGLCSLVVGFPFDTVKVRLQTLPSNINQNSAFRCFKNIIIHEGPFALFRGLSGLACVSLPRFALMFHSNAVTRNVLLKIDSSEGSEILIETNSIKYTLLHTLG